MLTALFVPPAAISSENHDSFLKHETGRFEVRFHPREIPLSTSRTGDLMARKAKSFRVGRVRVVCPRILYQGL
jgi:hypothetical protein